MKGGSLTLLIGPTGGVCDDKSKKWGISASLSNGFEALWTAGKSTGTDNKLEYSFGVSIDLVPFFTWSHVNVLQNRTRNGNFHLHLAKFALLVLPSEKAAVSSTRNHQSPSHLSGLILQRKQQRLRNQSLLAMESAKIALEIVSLRRSVDRLVVFRKLASVLVLQIFRSVEFKLWSENMYWQLT